GDGTSTVFFSASTSSNACPCLTASPTLTLTSRTSPPSRFSPSSGSLTSLAMQISTSASNESLRPHRIRLVRVDAEFLDCLLDLGRLDLAFAGQLVKGGHGDALRVHLE